MGSLRGLVLSIATVLLLVLFAQGAPDQTALQKAMGPIRPAEHTLLPKRDPGGRRRLMTADKVHMTDAVDVANAVATANSIAAVQGTDTADKTDTANHYGDFMHDLSHAYGIPHHHHYHGGYGGYGAPHVHTHYGTWGRRLMAAKEADKVSKADAAANTKSADATASVAAVQDMDKAYTAANTKSAGAHATVAAVQGVDKATHSGFGGFGGRHGGFEGGHGGFGGHGFDHDGFGHHHHHGGWDHWDGWRKLLGSK